ncbi:MAG: 2-dehydropantoate 2-reductase [Anaerolineales bacterium]
MKIVIFGAGGVGGYYGALLAKQGHAVTFVARGAHLQAMRQRGLQIKSAHGDFTIFPVRATDNPAELDPPELILFCAKAYDTESGARALTPIVAAQTSIVSLQNGVDAAERLGAALGAEKIIGGVTWISAAIESPGVIRQVSAFRRIALGEFSGQTTPRLQAIFAALQETGLSVELTPDIQKMLWTKFIFIAAASSFGALTRLPIGAYRSLPETRALIVQLMREVEALGRAQGVALDSDVVEKALGFLDGAEATIKASMQLDVEAGKQFELEAMLGVIVRKGRAAGLPTPLAETLYALLLPVLRRAGTSEDMI